MEKEKEVVEGIEKEQVDYLGKAKGIYGSIKEHLQPDFRKRYNVRRFLSCLLLYIILLGIFSNEMAILSIASLGAFLYAVLAFIFWHYSFWSYQGGIIDTFSRNLIQFGSIWGLVWKAIVQNILILLWIAFIAPFSGIKTWLKASKNNKVLMIENDRNDRWA